MSYATPAQFWASLHRINLFGEQGLAPGSWTDPAHPAGSGLGTVEVSSGSNPHDTLNVRVEVSGAGECDVPGRLNRAGLPVIRVSLDGGSTWQRRTRPDGNGRIPVYDGGFALQLTNGVEGTPVIFGSGNAALTVRAKHAGLTITIASGALATSFDEELGAITLYVTGTTTATAAAAHLANSGLPIRATAGGSGAGAVLVAAATALPYASFVVGDVWAFATSPSTAVVDELAVASDEMDGYFRGSLSLPLTDVGKMAQQVCVELARWRLIKRLGLHGRAEYQPYEPKAAMAWLAEVQAGHLLPTATEAPPSRSFPLLVPARDPLSIEAGTFPI